MTNSESQPNDPPLTQDELRRILELELQKTRSEASAARLEAKAAEIELMMRKVGSQDGSNGVNEPVVKNETVIRRVDAAAVTPSAVNPPHRFASWDQIRTAQISAAAQASVTHHPADPTPAATNQSFVPEELYVTPAQTGPPDQISSPPASIVHTDTPTGHRDLVRRDAEHSPVARPKFLDTATQDPTSDQDNHEAERTASNGIIELETDEDATAKLDLVDQAAIDQVAGTWSELADDEDEEPRQRARPAAWLVSAAAHVLILVALAAFGIQTQRPKDQVAFTASTSSSEETAMESFTIETAQLEVEPQETTEETPVEVEYEISPVGTMKVAEMMSDVSPAMTSSMAASMTGNAKSASAQPMSMKSDSPTKMKFCGVEGGGNHFVYLVDSSGSMKEGFESARRALLSSIDLLKPEQRFYVVFFDEEPDFMRITNPGQDEKRSVYATPENKAALRRWAMRISKDRGRAPYDPLRFALGLKPDVIFLLSDGAFPEKIVTLLKEENRVENLFGEVNPISIVHTISYHNEEGASIMKRIASQNSGQYRYVPKP